MPARAAATALSAASQATEGGSIAHREDRQHPVADELQHLAAEGVNRAGDAIEPGAEGRDHRLRRHGLRELGETSKIAIEQDGADGLARFAPQVSAQDLRCATPAEIGLEQRRRGRTCDKGGERCGGETRHLMQECGFILRQGPGERPAEQRIVGPRTRDIFLHHGGAEPGEPVAAEIALPGLERRQRPEAQRLDHHAALRGP